MNKYPWDNRSSIYIPSGAATTTYPSRRPGDNHLPARHHHAAPYAQRTPERTCCALPPLPYQAFCFNHQPLCSHRIGYWALRGNLNGQTTT